MAVDSETWIVSATALLDLYEVPTDERDVIESRLRPEPTTIDHSEYGPAVIRDNKPMSDSALNRCLEGITSSEWCRLLNGKVFFWATQDRLKRFLCARPSKSTGHTVLTVDTERLVSAYLESITLSSINSGATFPMKPAQRGYETFNGIIEHPYDQRRSAGLDPLSELAVAYSVPSIGELVVDISDRICDR